MIVPLPLPLFISRFPLSPLRSDDRERRGTSCAPLGNVARKVARRLEGNGALKLDRSIIYIYICISRDYARFPGGLIDAPDPGNDEGRGNARQLRRKSSRHFPPLGDWKSIPRGDKNRSRIEFCTDFNRFFYSTPPLPSSSSSSSSSSSRFLFLFDRNFLERKEEGSAGARLSRRRGLKFIVSWEWKELKEEGVCRRRVRAFANLRPRKCEEFRVRWRLELPLLPVRRLPSTFESRGIHPLRERAASVLLVEDVVDRRSF